MSVGAIGGCGGSGGGQDDAQTLTENDFSEDSSRSAAPDQRIIVDFLEAPDAEMPASDTGDAGTDVIPYKYARETSNTVCWEDDDPRAENYLTLVDGGGNEVLRVTANGGCVTKVIVPGDYEMRIFHDGLSNDTVPVFIAATDTDGQEPNNTTSSHGIFESVKRIVSATLRNLGTAQARAQGNVPPASARNVITLVTARQCVGCNLVRGHLRGAPLEGVKLNGADLTLADMAGANMTAADLTNATLTRADLTGATMTSTTLIEAKMRRAQLSQAGMVGAFLQRADLALADLTGADLTGADLTGAILIDAILTDADLNAATWTDGSLCRAGSTGKCVL